MANEESLLSRRLREVREAKKQAAQDKVQKPTRQTPEYLRPVSSLTSTTRAKAHPAAERAKNNTSSQFDSPERTRLQEPSQPCWITITHSRRHIALPATGQVILGRFDPHLGIPPDIDLAYEDWNHQSISRRHAKIVGVNGHHTIEDLGSRNGLFVNDERVAPGPSQPLRAGNRISIGSLAMVYDMVPGPVLNLRPTLSDRHFLMVAANGRKIPIAPADEIVIGRSDRYVEFAPQVDLSADGDAAVRVSRRHAIITWRDYSPYLEDLGSGFGTRLNGETLLIGQAVPIKPGDHIWLGGCVLAYDVEV